MHRSQIIAIAVALVAIVTLYNLPKVIINDTDKNKLSTESTSTEKAVSEAVNISPSDMKKLERLRNNFANAADVKKRCNFADSLAELYINLQKYDSSAAIADKLVLSNSDIATRKTAGNIYYKLYTLAGEPTVANSFATKAQDFYIEVLTKEPDNTTIKNNLAMTYVTSATPMKAIALLREVLAKNPNDETAIFNLGFLSIQSGQYAKAIERFEKLIQANPRNWKAHLYLGIALAESGKTAEAQEKFETVANNTKDPELKAQAEQMLGQKK